MNSDKKFCEVCREFTEYNIEPMSLTATLKRKKYSYSGEKALCKKCGSEMFIPEVHDKNLESLYKVFREKNDIITVSDIRDILEKYNIGKRPLSLLLGWGEHTISRYLDGDIPTRQYSEILKKILNDPSYYLEVLNSNKRRLKSDLTYKRSLKSLDGSTPDNPSVVCISENESLYITHSGIRLIETLRKEKDSGKQDGIYKDLQINLAYSSGKAEGSYLSFDQVYEIFFSNTVKCNGVLNISDIIKTVNIFRAIDYVIDTADEILSEKYIRKLHYLITNNIESCDIKFLDANEYAQQSSSTETDLKIESLLKSYNSREVTFEEVISLQSEFESLNPFQYGTKKVGALIMLKECLHNDFKDYVLEKSKQSPSIST